MNTTADQRPTWRALPRHLATAITLILAMLAMTTLHNAGLAWGKRKLDDLRYGRPRTVMLAEPLGLEADGGLPSAVIATNLDGQIALILLPAGDRAKAVSLPGPYLFGADGGDEVPQLSLDDLNGDGRPDLLLTVRGEQVVYLHRDDTFSLLTPAERAALAVASP